VSTEGLIPEPDTLSKRRLEAWPLPPYRYVPGRLPHPIQDPRGHLFNRSEPSHVGTFDFDRFWLRGLDLYDARFYWEAHEAWEACWRFVDDNSVDSAAIGGLIQLAASTLKHHMQQHRACQLLLAKAKNQLAHATEEGGEVYRCVHLLDSVVCVERFVDGGPWPVIVAGSL